MPTIFCAKSVSTSLSASLTLRRTIAEHLLAQRVVLLLAQAAGLVRARDQNSARQPGRAGPGGEDARGEGDALGRGAERAPAGAREPHEPGRPRAAAGRLPDRRDLPPEQDLRRRARAGRRAARGLPLGLDRGPRRQAALRARDEHVARPRLVRRGRGRRARERRETPRGLLPPARARAPPRLLRDAAAEKHAENTCTAALRPGCCGLR